MMSNWVFFSFLGGPVGQLPALLVHKPLLETSASAPARVRARVCSCVCACVRSRMLCVCVWAAGCLAHAHWPTCLSNLSDRPAIIVVNSGGWCKKWLVGCSNRQGVWGLVDLISCILLLLSITLLGESNSSTEMGGMCFHNSLREGDLSLLV